MARMIQKKVLNDKDALALNAKRLKMREKDLKPVKGMFKFYEVPGGTIEFPFLKYAEDRTPKMYKFEDGKIYTIPLMVAKHLNTSGTYDQYDYAPTEDNKGNVKVVGKVRRYGFQSLEFTDENEIGSAEESKVVIAESI